MADVPSDATMFVTLDWIPRHCIVPDGFRKGRPFTPYDWQLLYLGNFYLVRGAAVWVPENPILAPSFVYRRGLMVGPQKVGKSPATAVHVAVEGVGPAVFAGWAGKDEGYACADWGCRCGWEYAYTPGEPKGMPWPTPLIQITAYSEDQTDNIFGALRPMIDEGPLHDLIPKTGEEFIRLPGGGRIDTVTSSDQSRLGQRTTFVVQTEVGLWTDRSMHRVANTQYRNLAGMGGRASLETNAWDPSRKSVAQREFESPDEDLYRQFERPPKNLSYTNKAERRRIHRLVYPPDTHRENGGHVDLDAIEAEAVSLLVRDEAEAKRFFGNILATGIGKAFDVEQWQSLAVTKPHPVPAKALIAIGFDGSRRRDHASMIATELASGFQWPLGIWRPQDHDGEIPGDVVTATLAQAIEKFEVTRVYADPPYWEDTIAAWAGRFGKERIVEWWTNRPKAMAYAYRSWLEAWNTKAISHCLASDELCVMFAWHIGNAFKHDTGYRDDGGQLWYVEKEHSNSDLKIDSCPAAALSWEARNDAIAAGALNLEPEGRSAYSSYRSLTA